MYIVHVSNSLFLIIIQALLKLLQRYNPGNREDIQKTVLSLLSTPPLLSARSISERPLVVRALKLLFYMRELSTLLVVFMMAQFIEGDLELQQLIVNYLHQCGLEDPLGYFIRLLAQLDSLEQGPPIAGLELMSKCQKWLDGWAEQLVMTKSPSRHKSPAKYVGVSITVAALHMYMCCIFCELHY